MTRLFQSFFHVDQFLNVAFHHADHGDAGPVGHDFGHVFRIHLFLEHFLLFLGLLQTDLFLFHFFVQFDKFPVADLCRPGEISFPLGLLFFRLEAFDPGF